MGFFPTFPFNLLFVRFSFSKASPSTPTNTIARKVGSDIYDITKKVICDTGISRFYEMTGTISRKLSWTVQEPIDHPAFTGIILIKLTDF